MFTHPPTRYFMGLSVLPPGSRGHRPASIQQTACSLWPHGVFTWRRSWNFTRASGLDNAVEFAVFNDPGTQELSKQGRVLPMILQTSWSTLRWCSSEIPRVLSNMARKAPTSEDPVPVWYPEQVAEAASLNSGFLQRRSAEGLLVPAVADFEEGVHRLRPETRSPYRCHWLKALLGLRENVAHLLSQQLDEKVAKLHLPAPRQCLSSHSMWSRLSWRIAAYARVVAHRAHPS